MAPSYANIFMGVLEKNMLATAPQSKTPLFYKRFIDDVFGIWLFGEKALLAFVTIANKAHPSVNFTYRFGTEVDFMEQGDLGGYLNVYAAAGGFSRISRCSATARSLDSACSVTRRMAAF